MNFEEWFEGWFEGWFEDDGIPVRLSEYERNLIKNKLKDAFQEGRRSEREECIKRIRETSRLYKNKGDLQSLHDARILLEMALRLGRRK